MSVMFRKWLLKKSQYRGGREWEGHQHQTLSAPPMAVRGECKTARVKTKKRELLRWGRPNYRTIIQNCLTLQKE